MGSEMLAGSRASKPEITPSSNAASRTEREMGPTCPSVGVALVGKTGTRPNCAFIPKTPQQRGGYADGAAAVGAEREGRHPGGHRGCGSGAGAAGGLRRVPGVAGDARERAVAAARLAPELGRGGLAYDARPRGAARSTDGASCWTTFSAMVREPNVVLTPPTLMRSFTEIGTPCSGPGSLPRLNGLVRGPRGLHGLLGHRRDEGVEHGLKRLHPGEGLSHDLGRRDLIAHDRGPVISARWCSRCDPSRDASEDLLVENGEGPNGRAAAAL